LVNPARIHTPFYKVETMKNLIKAALVVATLATPMVSFADAPKTDTTKPADPPKTDAKTDAKAPAKTPAKAPAKAPAKTPATKDAPAAAPTAPATK
jgi:Ni/Co efflux regulator RcnB